MKKFKDISEFEDLLKDTLQGHSTPAPAEVWSNVAASTSQSAGLISQAVSFFSSTANILKVVLFAGGIATVGLVVYNETTQKEGNYPIEKQESSISETEGDSDGETTQNIESNSITNSDSVSLVTSKNTIGTKPSKLHKNDDRPLFGGIDLHNEVGTRDVELAKKINEEDIKLESTTKDKDLIVRASENRPCVGQNITLSATLACDWYLNNSLVAKNIKIYSVKCNQEGTFTYLAKSHGVEATSTIVVSKFEVQILAEQNQEGVYVFSLNDATLIANWHIDNKLVNTNATQITATIEQVGNHTIKASVVNHKCANPISKEVIIKAVGSFDYTTAFTVGNDGINDTYKIDISGYDNFSMLIFDPSGKQVFASLDPENGWNGSVNNNGAACAAGSYFARVSYKLIGETPVIKNIKLTLIRP
jgi:gliding motility-associated-like protein